MTNHVAGKTIIVTGAAGGFGRCLCERAAGLGANLIAADTDLAGLEQLAGAVAAAGGSIETVPTDVTELPQVRALARRAVDRFGRIDVLVNNAGIMPLAFYADHERAASPWDRCIDVNFKGVLHGVMAVYDQMIAQGQGHIVNLSSIYSNHPVAGAGVYGATKAAVNFLSEALRVESQGKIKVTLVKPTGVPATGLGAGIVNQEAIVGILGQNAPGYLQMMQAHLTKTLPGEYTDADNIEYFALAPEDLAEQIVHAIDQPWGISIGEITVRASGDAYIL